ncbi:septin-interacting protein 1 [Colias croceus]|uniref:septin-interacting protein 1 n=1 Tax=Colias crocea TaxID=72248 RepID=UPI001E27D922|nr:septin-interacting protein 1 [Colias croceus]
MSDDEVIRFEITDHDLDNEFNPNRSRKNKREQQIYGVWAKDSDEEDNEDNIRKRTRKPKDFSAPIGFVAGGVQQAGKKKENKQELESAEPSVSQINLNDSSDEEVSNPAESETAGIRRAGQGMRPANLGGNVGSWEKHTKGIGAKLLLQMGYQPGKGLGKDLQGISAPVEATLRKGRGAIGAYGPEKAAMKIKKDEERRQKEEAEKEKAATPKAYNWKKSHKGRYFYRDAADVIQEGKPSIHTASSSELSSVPVIDLTGREKRVLSGYHALRAAAPRYEHEPRRECTNFAVPALTHNLQVAVENCEQEIIDNARSLQRTGDQMIELQREVEQFNQLIQEQDIVIDKLEWVLKSVERLNKPDISLEMAYETLVETKEKSPVEYELFGLGTIGAHVVNPLFSCLLAKWDPLRYPTENVDTFLKWKQVLTEDSYTMLLWQHFLPKITSASEVWNPRVPEPMLRVFSAWADACGGWVVAGCVTKCVAPRLLSAVRSWDPTSDTQPLHEWVLPWHPLAGEALSASVYPLIRSRLASALAAWHPADASAKPLLAAWQQAWGSALTMMLHHHIVPKLEHCLQHAPLELVGRENTAWLWCVQWVDLVGAPTIAALAGRALLPRWLGALAAWLNTAPPHATVLASYTDFKKMFPAEVLKEPVVRDAFRKALDMMNRSTDIDPIEPPPPPRFTMPENKPEPSIIIPDALSTNTLKSFSELLESRCMEKGITFVPMPGKTREGRPIYKIGDMQCYVIRTIIMYSDDNGRNFAPVSMEKLLRMVEE